MMKKYISIAILIFTITSCEKVINVDLKNADPKLVIEGVVDNSGKPAKVVLSKSVAFSINNIYPAVSGATVKVIDNLGNSYTLSENPLGTYTNATLIGVPGRTYNMTVQAEGKTYTASSRMPLQVNLDSVFQEKITITKPIVFASALFVDPVGFGNYYNFIQTVNGKRSKNIYAIDDIYQDGGIVINQLFDQDNSLKPGDKVKIEMQCINKLTYRYLVGLQDLQFNNSVPANPDNNITNNALGFFSAHTAQVDSLVIQ
jgi:Domain of unknown function (DUF4249)